MDAQKYNFIRALRPFSFSVALIACGVGVVAATNEGFWDLLRVCLVICGGVLIQAAVNLLNDHGDKKLWSSLHQEQWPERDKVISKINRNLKVALVCGLIAIAIGLWLVALTNMGLFALCIIGLLGGYFYTAEPVNYKRRGLGVLLVFWFTGVLMVCGAYYALSGGLSITILLLSLPVAILSSLLLLSNELRDQAEDLQQGSKTLTVRLGFVAARRLYVAMLLVCYFVCLLLWNNGFIHRLTWLLPSLLFALWLGFRVLKEKQPGAQLPPLTGRFFMLFGIGYLFCL